MVMWVSLAIKKRGVKLPKKKPRSCSRVKIAHKWPLIGLSIYQMEF